MTKIEQILDKYNFLKRTENPIISIEEVESIVHFELPEDYKFYLLNYLKNEGFIGNEFVSLWDLDEILEINKGYGIVENLDKTIGIGSNGDSEFIAIEFVQKDEYRIVLSPFIDVDADCHIEIGNSFTEMFERLEKGQEWF